MGKNHKIVITGNTEQSVIISGDNNVVLFSNPSLPLEIGMVTETHHTVNPYLGIASFTEKDADRFFGRDKLIDRIYSAFLDLFEKQASDQRATRVLSILGPSGSGKSSVVRAGFLAELARRSIPGYKNIHTAIITPGSRPIEQLAGVLSRIESGEHSSFKKIDEFETRLKEQSKKGNYDCLRFMVDHLPGVDRQPLIFIVDQFEELFDRCKQERDRSAFIKNLLHAASDPDHSVSVILVMRSDFLDAVSHFQELSHLMSEQAILVPSMNTGELESAITEPAANAGRPIDSATIELLLAQCIDREGVLPRLQITLEQIWEGMVQGRAPKDTLSALGGVGGSLGTIAQKIFNELSIDQQQVAKCAFIAMVQSGGNRQWTRRRVAVSELVDTNHTRDQVVGTLRCFAERGNRLLTLSGDSFGGVFVEVVHEALFKNWRLLKKWLEEFQPLILLHRRLNEAARDWQVKGCPNGLLWRSPALEDVERLANHPVIKLTQTEQAFFDTSQWAQNRSMRAKRISFGISIAAALLMTFLAVFSYTKKKEADREKVVAQQQKEEAQEQTKLAIAHRLAAQSNQIFSNEVSKPKALEKAALLAVESLKLAQTVEGYHAWEQAVIRFPSWQQRYAYDGSIGPLALSPDGKSMATTIQTGSPLASGSVAIFHVNGDSPAVSIDFNGGVTAIRFSPDSRLLAAASWDHKVILSDVKTGEILSTLTLDESASEIAFSQDGLKMGVACANGTVIVYATAELRELTRVQHENGVNTVCFTPDSKSIVTAGNDKKVIFWNADTGQNVAEFQHDAPVVRMLISPDGRKLVSKCDKDLAFRVWDIANRQVIYRLKHDGEVNDMVISKDVSIIATASEDGAVKIWDAKSGTEKACLNHQSPLMGLDLSTNAKQVLAIERNTRQVVVWDIRSQRPRLTLDHPVLRRAVFSPDGQRIATAGHDKMIRIWDVANGKEIRKISTPGKNFLLTFSPDGRHLAYSIRKRPLGYDFSYSKSWSNTIVLDLDRGKEKLQFAGHPAHTSSIGYSPDGRHIITGSWDGTVRLWDASTGIEQKRLVETGPVVGVTFSHDGERIFTQVAASTLDFHGRYFQEGHVWDLEHSKIKAVFPSPGGILLWHLMEKKQKMWTAGTDATIRLWDVNNGNEIRRTTLPTEEKAKDIHPDGNFIATVHSSEKEKVIIRVLPSGKKQAVLEHEKPVGRIVFSPDGTTLVSETSGKKELWVWDLKASKILCRIANPEDVDKVQKIQSWSVNTDGSLLSTSDMHGVVHVWNPYNGKRTSELQHPRQASQKGFFILASAFSGDGKRIITQSGHSIIVWDPISGQQFGSVNIDSDLLNIETSADGQMFRTFDKGGIKIWDTINCKLKNAFELNIGLFGSYSSFSLDSRYVYASVGNKFHIWNLETGQQITRIKNSGDIIGLPEILSDIDLLITKNSAGRISGRFLSTGKQKYSIGHTAATKRIDLKLEADIAVSVNGDMAEAYDLGNGTKLATFSYQDGGVAYQLSPDGTKLVTSPEVGDDEQLIDVWDAGSGNRLSTISDQAELSDIFAFSSKGDKLAIPDRDGGVHVWDTENFKKLLKLQINSRVGQVRFSPDDRLLAIDTGEHQFQVWDWEAGSRIIQIPHADGIDNFIFSNDSNQLITKNNKGVIRVWEISKPESQPLSLKHEKDVEKIVITPDGRLMVTIQNHTGIDYVTVWDVAQSKERYRIHPAKDTIAANQSASQSVINDSEDTTKGYLEDIALNPDGRILVTAGADGKINVWHIKNGHKITQWKYQHHYPKITFSRDGTLLMIHTTLVEKEQGYWRNRDLVVIRSVADGYRKISQIEGYFTEVLMTKNADKIVTAEGEKEHKMADSLSSTKRRRSISDPAAFWGIRVWDTRSGKELVRMPHKSPIQSVQLNNNGDILGTHYYGVSRKDFRLFDISTGKEFKVLPENESNSLNRILFSPDDKVAVIKSYRVITVWDTATWQQITKFSSAGEIEDLQFSPKTHYLAWKSEGKIWVWDWKLDRNIAVVNANNPYGPFLFSPDEKYLISADKQGNVNLFLWRDEDLIADACRRLEHNLSEQDWQTYMGTIPYEPTCSGLPVAKSW